MAMLRVKNRLKPLAKATVSISLAIALWTTYMQPCSN